MSFQDEFVVLRCPQCGGAVKLTKDVVSTHFADLGEGEFFYRSHADDARCESCNTSFVQRSTLSAYDGRNVTISTGGGAHIGGSLTISGGDFVGRDKTETTVAVQQVSRTSTRRS